MKKISYSLLALITFITLSGHARELTGSDAHRLISGAQKITITEASSVPQRVQFREGAEVSFNLFEKWARANFKLPSSCGFKLINTATDKLGYTHHRYQQTINGAPVEGTMYIVHSLNNSITSMNGLLFDNIKSVDASAIMTEKTALNKALDYMGASQYRWQIPSWEKQIKSIKNDPSATWFPKGELFYAPLDAKYSADNYRLCYRFDVYAQQPLKREYVFVDAKSGQIVLTVNRIKEGNATGTAVTGYSGPRTITTDSVAANSYRLRETGRGLGIETYNLEQGTNYVNTDFTDEDNNWNNVNAQLDQYAGDAHWGAEMTYDFYNINFGRSSVDNAGKKLVSYVHYDTGFINAFWDGDEMTYGDGGGGYTPLTSLDIAGHEISHGVTEFSSGLIYSDESGALNEAFSDCMGNAIRYYGKQPASVDWLIGNEIGGSPFRSMSNPKQYGNPDCYGGQYWNAPNEVHNNSGVMNHWFYLLTEGGNGTNDIGNTYSLTGVGIDKAAAICYRMNAIYLTPSSRYADARYYSIIAAIDLYGPCTPEVIATTNAWYAVGVGAAFVPGVSSDFIAPVTSFCQTPATVNFTNASNNAGSFIWDFGDGSAVSTAVNPVHTYAAYGTYTVRLIADAGTCGIDTTDKIAYISVDVLNPCIVILPPNGIASTQTACTGQLFDSGGPAGDYTDNTNATVTIAPAGASTVTLTFASFNMEDTYDFLYVYDGPSAASPLIGAYTGTNLPNGGTITSSSGSITLRQTTDPGVTAPGFALTWQCALPNVAPTPAFIANVTVSCSGTIQFTDQSTNGPNSWSWDFGDGSPVSTDQNPVHTYTGSGTYDVQLTVTNNIGTNSLTLLAYITINLPVAPSANAVTSCAGYSASLTAAGADSLRWFTTPTGGTPVATGGVFTTPSLSASTTYYVESDIYPAAQFNGPPDNTFSGGGIFTNTNYHQLIFDCYTPVTLVSVKVYAQGAGDRTITLIDQNGSTLQSKTINIPDGMSIVPLNFPIPVGTNLELGAEGNVNLYRNNAGASFPYMLPGVISITGTNAGNDYYYYFYDWKLQGPPCEGPRTAVDVTVLPSPTAAFTSSVTSNVVSFTNNSTGAVNWFWDFGDGNNSTLQDDMHTYSAVGSYTVMLVAYGANNCTDTTYQTIDITTVGIDENNQSILSVYPNPVKDNLLITFGTTTQNKAVTLKMTNAIGQLVMEKKLTSSETKNNFNWNVSSLAPGVYTLLVGNVQEKIIKQ